MLKRTLTVAALVALAAPVAAQDAAQPIWSSDRPDGVAPAGIVGDRLLEPGALEFTYRFRKIGFEGVQVGTTPVDFFDVLELYSTTPFQRRDRLNDVQLTYGVSERVSLVGTASWIERTRSLANEEFFFSTSASGLSDVQVEMLYGVWDSDAIKVHLHGGVEIPVGSTDERGDLLDLQDQVLPYEMQLGSGSFSVMPGLTAQIQNEHGTVGGQVRARIRLNDNDRDYRLGDEVEGSMWMMYRVNRFFAFSTGMRFRSWGSIEGVDTSLDPSRDPGEDAVFSGGEQVDIPVGLNVYMPEGRLQGHRLGVEFLFPVHQDFDAWRLAGDWGLTLSWRKAF
jgi:hypothetical protein